MAQTFLWPHSSLHLFEVPAIAVIYRTNNNFVPQGHMLGPSLFVLIDSDIF